jgi:large subunit ribosomal protein L31
MHLPGILAWRIAVMDERPPFAHHHHQSRRYPNGPSRRGSNNMREGIHPKWYPDAKVSCASCGTTWTVGATRPTLQVDVCSNCHPFYTGEQRIVDTEGRVDRFMKRLEVRSNIAADRDARVPGSSDFPLSELGVGRQYVDLLAANGITTAGQFVQRLEEGGDDAIVEIRGIGRKVLTDIKKKLRARGYELPAGQS